jgi:hypothetical protein
LVIIKSKNIFNFFISSILKGSNGVVAVGFPHRNYSVLKQADPNKQKVKGSDPPSAVGGLEGNNAK